MKLILDSRRFPRVPCQGITFGLLPVMKSEFDYYLGDSRNLDPNSYQDMITVAPRTAWRNVPTDAVVGTLLTGIWDEECRRFAAWAYPQGRLPTDQEWRAFDLAMNEPVDRREITTLASHPQLHPAARAILAAVRPHAKTWREVALLSGGILERVDSAAGVGLYGRPSQSVFALLLEPQSNPPARPKGTGRHRAFGFRVVAPLRKGK